MKRSTPMRRTSLSRKEGPSGDRPEHPQAKEPRKRSTLARAPSRCKHCREKFTAEERARAMRLHSACEAGFAEGFAAKLQKEREREARARAKAERASDRALREERKSIPDLIRDADEAFADFIRLRDRLAGHPCISSGRALDWSGNKVDAGHYRSRGAASHLRYDEDNCHAQTKQDNLWKSGNVVEYRIRLIARIGLARVEAIESSNAVHKWTREELRSIAAHYRAKRRELEKGKA